MDLLIHVEADRYAYANRVANPVYLTQDKDTFLETIECTNMPVKKVKKAAMGLEAIEFTEAPPRASKNKDDVKFTLRTRIFFTRLREWWKEKKAKIREALSKLTAPGLYKFKRNGEVGGAIRAYALQLATDKSTTFSQNIENFIQCTKESKESSPQVVMRNMRQFMSGMKNYLVKHGEREFEKEVEKERLKLKANEFLNLDHILEDVMMHLVVRPLREHVYKLFVEYYAADGSLKMLAESIQIAQSKSMYDFGVQEKILPPLDVNIERIRNTIQVLQNADSPLEKLDHLLVAISTMYNTVRHMNSNKIVLMGADDLLPLMIWILARCKFVDAEIESEFMWGLIHPSQLSGEGGYYLTTLSSAVQILKSMKSSQGTMSTINVSEEQDEDKLLTSGQPLNDENEIDG